MDRELIVLFYDTKYTTQEEVHQVSSFLTGNIKKPVLFLPKEWSLQFMTKEQALQSLEEAKTFVENLYE